MVYICHKSKRLDLLGRNVEEQVMLATVYGVLKDTGSAFIQLVYGKYDQNNTFENAVKETAKSFKEGHLKKLNGLLGNK